MKKLVLSCIAILAIAISANAQSTVTFNGAVAGQSYNFSTSILSGGPATGYVWTRIANNNISTITGSTTSGETVTINAGPIANGSLDTIRVTASNAASCSSVAQTLIVVVGNASFNVTSITSANASICQNNANSFTVNYNKTGAPAATITSFNYYLDIDGDGTMNGAESIANQAVVSQTTYTLTVPANTFNTATPNARIVVTAVNGSLTGNAISSAANSNAAVAVLEIPVLSPIIAN